MTGPVTLPMLRGGTVRKEVAERAYEVYGKFYGEQSFERLHQRGGFGAGELIAFLYARTFPESEWRARMDEALKGLKVGG